MASVVFRAALVASVVLSLGTASCGADKKSGSTGTTGDPVQVCRNQWHEVAANLVGLDVDEHPSAMAKRWQNVLATVTIYEDTKTADKCQENIETLSTGITELRQFNARVQPYDMEYQVDRVADGITRYLADPLPAPVRKDGKLVKPPTKAAVLEALATLTGNAGAANADLAPAWGQLIGISLDDQTALATALQDLDFLAKDSTSWVACRNALKVLDAAILNQQPASGTPAPSPSATSTP